MLTSDIELWYDLCFKALKKKKGESPFPKEEKPERSPVRIDLESLTDEDMKLDHPYNTYLYPGLPPGPISNPSLASLNAAVDPDENTYYFSTVFKNHLGVSPKNYAK